MATSIFRWVYPQDLDIRRDESYTVKTSIINELILLGCQKYTEAYPLQLHSHDYGYEFVYLEQGTATWEINGICYPTSAGEWFFTYPGELHKARFNHMEPCRIWWFILRDPVDDPHWFQLDIKESEAIIDRIRKLPRVFRASTRVRDQFVRLKATLEIEDPNKALFVRHQTLDILLSMLQPASSKAIEQKLKETIIRIFHQITQTPEKRISVAELARAVQVSESYFYKVIHDLLGQSPASYIERIRMEHACRLLNSEMTITEIALELGYKTSQHFTTAFKKVIGSSPSVWRKQERM